LLPGHIANGDKREMLKNFFGSGCIATINIVASHISGFCSLLSICEEQKQYLIRLHAKAQRNRKDAATFVFKLCGFA
jgi:hypothetical protein